MRPSWRMTSSPCRNTCARQRSEEELAADISGGMALLCIVLAAAGLFGVTLYAVGRRMREFGVRVAMGATPALLARQVIREALRLALAAAAVSARRAAHADPIAALRVE